MMSIEQVASWFPPAYRKKQFFRYMFREHLQYKILDFIANTPASPNITFIGGTCLRLVHGIDRFSEDLDFDLKNIGKKQFLDITDSVVRFLQTSGYQVVADDKEKDDALNAFRRNLVFPEFLYKNKLSPFKEEKFLIKIEGQDQMKTYQAEKSLLRGCGHVFRFNTPPTPVLCAMKICALLDRGKGRDFYDVLFLLGKTEPDYSFFDASLQIGNKKELKTALMKLCRETNLKLKMRDFGHLLFNQDQGNKIMHFEEFVKHY